MKVLLATPALGGQVCTGYHESVLKTLLFFKGEYPDIEFESRVISISMLSLVRNAFASMVLNDPSYTHLLFIDSDMGFRPELIAKMLVFDNPVTGVIAPQRKFDYAAYHRACVAHDDAHLARLLAAQYIGVAGGDILDPAPNGEHVVHVRDGFIRTKHAGTGIMLIARSVFETMKERFPDLWVADPGHIGRDLGVNGGLLQCFDPVKNADGIYTGEDIAFCKRWVEGCGGEIWANVDEPILHIGQEGFLGQYVHQLQLMAEAAKSQAIEGSDSRQQRRANARRG